VRFTEAPSINYYEDLEKNKNAERDELRQYERRADRNLYEPILLEVLRLFGIAIHTSLERTLGKYLKATDGIFRNDLRSDWKLSKVGKLLCTNNASERPFGVAKGNARVYLAPFPTISNMSTYSTAYMNIYQSLSLRTLATFTWQCALGLIDPLNQKGNKAEHKTKREDNVAQLF
jgi:hypothetical protein